MTSVQPVARMKRSRLLAEIPPFHPLAIKLLKLAGDPSCSLAQVVTLLRSDAVFAAEVLRLANSPLFGNRAEITSILQALAFLGLDHINTLIVTTSMRGLVDHSRSPLTHSCWRHNLATALICQQLSKGARLEPETCYVAGLIHDIGRLALLRVFPDYEAAMIQAETAETDLLAGERELFGIDHGEAGRWLLSQWGCPIELQNVAAFHEDPPAAHRDSALIHLVHTGSRLADAMKMSVFPGVRRIELPQELRQGLPELADWVLTKVNEVEISLV